MSQNPDTKGFFTMILAEVVFTVDGDLQILRRQLVEKSDVETFNTKHLSLIQNRAAAEVLGSFPKEVAEKIQILDVLFVNIIKLGEMTNLEFFGEELAEGANEAEAQAHVQVEEEAATVAAPETDTADNVTQFPGTPA